jgi:hypothetical protein
MFNKFLHLPPELRVKVYEFVCDDLVLKWQESEEIRKKASKS